MLNGQKVNISLGEGDFQPIPAGAYTVQATDVNLKTVFNTFKQVEQDVLNFEFSILDNLTDTIKNDKDEDEIVSLRGRKLWKRTSLSLNSKSWLYKLASAILGEMTHDQKEAFQPEDLIDKQVTVLVEIQEGTGKNAGNKYNNILSFSKVKKELSPFENDKTKEGAVRETKPVMTDEESDDFITGLEKDKEKDLKEPEVKQ